jgi:hypothetical protein
MQTYTLYVARRPPQSHATPPVVARRPPQSPATPPVVWELRARTISWHAGRARSLRTSRTQHFVARVTCAKFQHVAHTLFRRAQHLHDEMCHFHCIFSRKFMKFLLRTPAARARESLLHPWTSLGRPVFMYGKTASGAARVYTNLQKSRFPIVRGDN